MDDHADKIRAAFARIVAEAPEPPEMPDAATDAVGGRRGRGPLTALAAAAVVLIVIGAAALLRPSAPAVTPGTAPTSEAVYVDTTLVAPGEVSMVDVAFLIDPSVDVSSWEAHLEAAAIGPNGEAKIDVLDAGTVAAIAGPTLGGRVRPVGVVVVQGLSADAGARIVDALGSGAPIPGITVSDGDGGSVALSDELLRAVVVSSREGISPFVSPSVDEPLRADLAGLGIRVLMRQTGRFGVVTGTEALTVRAVAVDGFGRPDLLEERWRRLIEQACDAVESDGSLEPVAEQFVGDGFGMDRASALVERIVAIACPEAIPPDDLQIVPWPPAGGFDAVAVAQMPVQVPAAPEPVCCASPGSPFETGVPLGPGDLTDADRELIRQAAAPMFEVGGTPPPYRAFAVFRYRKDLVVVLEGGNGFRRAFTVRREGDGILTEILAEAGQPAYTFGDRSVRIVWLDVPPGTAWVSLTSPIVGSEPRPAIQRPYAGAVFFAIARPSFDQYVQLIAQDADEDVLGGVELLVDGGGCSARGLDPEIEPQPGLPEEVAATRAAIARAAASCDLAALADLAAYPEGFYFWLAAPPTAQNLADVDRRTGELRTLYQTLRTPFGVRPIADAEGVWHDVYLWPSAAAYDRFEDVPAQEWTRTEDLLGDLDERQFADSGFIDFRIGIRADGLWSFALAGD